MTRPIFYYITDRHAFSGDERSCRQQLLNKIEEACHAGVDYIQLREKELPARELEALSREALKIVRETSPRTPNDERLTEFLINSRTDIALTIGADGVHLPATDLTPEDIHRIWKLSDASNTSRIKITVSCHSAEEVRKAEASGADLAIFAPVFEKKDAPETRPTGLGALKQACQHKIPVIALGGITLENGGACLDAGAVGIAGIRLFQEHNIDEIVARLRG